MQGGRGIQEPDVALGSTDPGLYYVSALSIAFTSLITPGDLTVLQESLLFNWGRDVGTTSIVEPKAPITFPTWPRTNIRCALHDTSC